MPRMLALPLVLALASPAFAQDYITLTPEQIGQIFCISAVGNDMAPIEAILTDDLNKAIDVASEKDNAFADKYPDEKPPLGDGLGWTAAPDYSNDCTVGQATLMMDEAKVTISFKFADYPAANYNQTLMLKLVEGQYGEKLWRIDNVVYPEGDMRTMLITAFMEN